MSNYDDVAERWIDRALGHTTKGPLIARGGRMYCTTNHQIYSYGSHFEMGRVLFHGDEPYAILLNGDTYSPTTSRHQGIVRSAAARARLERVIIPYSALAAAGVDRNTIELVDVQPDRNVVTPHVFHEIQPSWRWHDDPIYADVPYTSEEVDAAVAKAYGTLYAEWDRGRELGARWLAEALAEETPRDYWVNSCRLKVNAPKPTWADARKKAHCCWHGSGHPLTHHRQVVSHERNLYTNGHFNRQVQVEQLDDGRMRYSYETSRHWLGGSLIRASYDEQRWVKCRHCKKGRVEEINPLYDDEFWRERMETNPEYVERLRHECTECGGRGTKLRTRNKTAYFLSDFDHDEPRELYFFCELPQGVQPATCEDALECLKPETVRIAEQIGREVRRQGDIFAIQLKQVTKRDLHKAGARIEKRGGLLGTNHVATEVAYMPNGQTLCRGTLTHAPQRRRPDHVRVKLDAGWHVVLKNTVPIG